MKIILTTLLLLATAVAAHAQNAGMARGADVSWCTEMEADGRQFLDANGAPTDIFALMKDLGMTAVRLRVWVNPTAGGYGPWSDKADVLAKARRAKAQGLDLLVDFHYSDIFADPGTQTAPLDWAGYSAEQTRQAVAAHTRDVLQALKDEGIAPRWVQVGNETNQGMVWDRGKIDWTKSGTARFTDYVAMSNAGYDAVKEVLPQALVVVHIAEAYKASDSDCWFFKDFKNAGGKFDVIGLSHYPDAAKWSSTTAGDQSNANAVKSVKALGEKFGVPVMLVETGFSCYEATTASQVMHDLMGRLEQTPQCAGVFYWEPEVDGQWRPAYYEQKKWNAYAMGAFTTYGRPTIALDAFGPDGSKAQSHKPLQLQVYSENGNTVLATLHRVSADGTRYRGKLSVGTAWLNFFIVDAESNTWYGTVPNDKTTLLAADGKWNCWIDSDQTGTYELEVDLSTLKWTQTLSNGSDGIAVPLSDDADGGVRSYDLLGRVAAPSAHIVLMKSGHTVRKVMVPRK